MGRRSSPNSELMLSVNRLSQVLGLDRATVQKRLDARGAPFEPGPKGAKLYRLPDAIRACLADFIGADEPSSYEDARTREMKARAQLQELELALRRGEVLSAAECERVWTDEVARARARILSVPPSLAPALSAETSEAACKDILEAALYDAIDELAGGDRTGNRRRDEGQAGMEGAA